MSNLLFPFNGNYNLYPAQIASLWHGRTFLPDPSFSRSKDPNRWGKYQRDPIVKMAIQKRLHSVAAKDWRMEPGGEEEVDEKAAAWMRWMLLKPKGFGQARLHGAKAVFLGESWNFVAGKFKRLRYEGTFREFWTPTHFQQIDNERFRRVPMWRAPDGTLSRTATDDARAVHQLQISSMVNIGQWIDVTDTRSLLHVEYDSEERRLGYGGGIEDAIYFYHHAKGILLREFLQLAEKLGQGMAIVEIDGSTIGSEERDNDSVRDAYADAVEEMRARNTFVMSKLDNLRFEFPDAAGWQLFESGMRYLDDCVTRLILGGTLPSGGGGDNGSFARSETEADSEEALIQFDRELQAECITDTLVKLVWDANYEARVEMGLADAEMPKYAPFQEKHQDPRAFAEIAEIALRSGVSIVESEYRERVGLSTPGKDDDVIEPIQPMMAGAGAGGFGGDPQGNAA